MTSFLIFFAFASLLAVVSQLTVSALVWFYRQVVGSKETRDARLPVIQELSIFQDGPEKASLRETAVKLSARLKKKAPASLPARLQKKVVDSAPVLSSKHAAWIAAMDQFDRDEAYYATLDSPAYLRRALAA